MSSGMNRSAPRRWAHEVYKRLEEANVLNKIPDRLDPNLVFSEDEDEDSSFSEESVCFTEESEVLLSQFNEPKKTSPCQDLQLSLCSYQNVPNLQLSYKDRIENRKKVYNETLEKISKLSIKKSPIRTQLFMSHEKNCQSLISSELISSTPQLRHSLKHFGKESGDNSFSNIVSDLPRKDLFENSGQSKLLEELSSEIVPIKSEREVQLSNGGSSIDTASFFSGNVNVSKSTPFKEFKCMLSGEQIVPPVSYALKQEQCLKPVQYISQEDVALEQIGPTIEPLSLLNDIVLQKQKEHVPKIIPKTETACSPIPEMFANKSKEEIIFVNNKIYSILSELGTGGSCKVYAAFDKKTKSVVAIKRVNLLHSDQALREGYVKEMEYLKILQGTNHVIKLFDHECRKDEILLVMEKGDTDLAHFLNDVKQMKNLTPLMIKFYWSQMLKAVAEIHEHGIVHSDLKPANFLLVSGHLKLIDFGISAAVPSDMTSAIRESQVGTLNYMSPETITCYKLPNADAAVYKVCVKSDVWSLGCILYNLVYGQTPFQKFRFLMQKIEAITNPEYDIPFPSIADLSLLDVMKKCLKRNPKERASVEDLLNHPYLKTDRKLSVSETDPDDNVKNLVAQITSLTPRRISAVSDVVRKLSNERKKSEL